MRGGTVAVGLVLLILGVVLWYLPIAGQMSTTLSIPAGSEESIGDPAPVALLTKTVSFTVSWSSSSSVTVRVYDCGTNQNSCSTITNATSPVASGSGSTGSLTWSGPKGEYFAVVPSGSTTATISYSAPLANGLAGLGLTILGFLVFLIGLARKAKTPPAPAPMSPTPPA